MQQQQQQHTEVLPGELHPEAQTEEGFEAGVGAESRLVPWR